MQDKNHYNFIDIMRLFAMFFVYVVHYSYMGRYSDYFFLLLVPCFFFCSGFTSYRRSEEGLKQFVLLKLQRVAWPYISFSAISLFFQILFMELPLSGIIEWVKNIAYGARNVVPVVALWFLPCLFVLSILYHILQKAVKNKLLLLALCFVISASVKFIREEPVWPWGIDMAGRFLIYYALGDYVHHLLYKYPPSLWKTRTKIMLVLAVVPCAFVSFFGFYFGIRYIPSLFSIFEPPFYMLAAEQFLYIITGMVCVLFISVCLQNVKPLCEAGKYTMWLCGLEKIVKLSLPFAFSAIGLTLSTEGGQAMLLQGIITMVICYYLFAKPLQKYMPAIVNFKYIINAFKENDKKKI